MFQVVVKPCGRSREQITARGYLQGACHSSGDRLPLVRSLCPRGGRRAAPQRRSGEQPPYLLLRPKLRRPGEGTAVTMTPAGARAAWPEPGDSFQGTPRCCRLPRNEAGLTCRSHLISEAVHTQCSVILRTKDRCCRFTCDMILSCHLKELL